MLRICSWYIDGYGIFSKYREDLDNASFVLVYGNNERGKSTVFSFLRTMISGFPGSRQSKEKKYEPVNGGTQGGCLELWYDSSIIKLSRFQKTKSPQYELTEGTEASLLALRDILDSLERDHFKSIFAFDIEELTRLSLLDDDSLNESLFSSTISGSTSVITDCSTRLRERCRELLKPKSKGIIQNLDDRLLKINEQKRKLLLETGKALEIQASIDKTSHETDLLEKKITALEQQIKNQEQLMRTAALGQEVEGIREQLAELLELRLPDEEHISYFFRLRAKGQLLESPQTGNSSTLKDLEEKRDQVREQKEKLSSLYSLYEEAGNKNTEIVLFDEKRFIDTKKKKFFLIFSLLCLIISLPLFYYSETVYGVSFVIFSLIGFFLFSRCRRLLDSLENRLEHEIAEKNNMEEKIHARASVLGLEEISGESLELAILKADREFHNITFRIDQEKEKVAQDINARNSYHDEMKEFLQSFSCATPELFEARIGSSETVRQLRTREEELLRIIGKDQQNFSSGAEDLPVELYSEDLHAEKERLKNALHETIAANSELRLRLSELADSDLLQSCMLEEELARKQYNDALHEWRASMLAIDLLEKALHRLVEGKYKGVLDEAGKILSKITSGAYTKITVSSQKNELQVLHNTGSMLVSSELSRGTIEQVYLSVRLALAQHFGRTFYPLPILLDDILVNFDYDRAKYMIEVLNEISKYHQVIFFTCHTWIRELVSECVPECMEIELS